MMTHNRIESAGCDDRIKRFVAPLIQNLHAGSDTVILTFALPRAAEVPKPGQFMMIKSERPGFPLFARAFSIFDYREKPDGAEVDFLVKAVGQGTGLLTRAEPGDRALLVGPLGHGFPDPPDDTELILVGGGTGVAPFCFLLNDFKRRGHVERRVILLHGARDAGSLLGFERFASLPFEAQAATEDGSFGTKGLIDVLLRQKLAEREDRGAAWVFVCGPDPMMKAISLITERHNLPTFLSLETRMACGTGICNGCAVAFEEKTGDQKTLHYLRACYDGPVFPATQLPEFRSTCRAESTGKAPPDRHGTVDEQGKRV